MIFEVLTQVALVPSLGYLVLYLGQLHVDQFVEFCHQFVVAFL